MPEKRGRGSPELVPNPFIKKRNLEWSIELTGLAHDAEDSSSSLSSLSPSPPAQADEPKTSAVEAGEAKVDDHLAYFCGILAKATLAPFPNGMPQLPVTNYRELYDAHFGKREGAHFVIHQHDHPIAGTHYDLRLQINETSSASWAIMYGLPGDPNSQRLNRNATETRVHCLWNHLVETASTSTGSLLIWDTGTYTVLQRRSKYAPAEDPDSQPSAPGASPQLTEQEKLNQAFKARKIRLELNGSRLPRNYVLSLRLTKSEDAAGRAKIGRKPKTRRRRGGAKTKAPEPMTSSDSDSDRNTGKAGVGGEEDIVHAPAEVDQEGVSAMEREIRELEDEEVRKTNAYTGATNTIGSVHQRKWYLSLDREACGFVKRRKQGKVIWECVEEHEDVGDARLRFPFHVKGAEVERSVVTGRQGAEVLKDEGVVDFVARKGWRPVLN
ncbi:DNA polymerase ligase-domain-containing protein [Pseudomassariella vexata]|uniref:DNA polymerase ligase-domain-containing protein n=1 Tax=Pseudomassariella vexata TaxID=1141098 RepID=A0A1Y2DDK4_9PEZI|nr:DNA polymerase ligase-domain-containing protein [Pseudomassariella vexata]ORY57184.1 DNA polymerase ligase-domain-containing protein [Pseudomassariella vexata]